MTIPRDSGRPSRIARAFARLAISQPLGSILLALAIASPLAAHADADPENLASELDRTKSELAQTRDELALTREALATLSRKVDALESARPAAASSESTGATARLAPVNADNPAVSFVVDTIGYSNSRAEPFEFRANDGVGFELQSAELFVSAPVDPFLRAYGVFAASTLEGFDVEEAALVTTGLPWNLGVKGGRFFADVGRLSHFHPEMLPFVDRPPSIDRMVGGESQAEGAELSWLAPLPFFAQLTLGAYNRVGAERIEEPDEFGLPFGTRSFSELTYLARPLFYFDVTDSFGVEFGGTGLFIPRDHERALYGLDVTLRHQSGTRGFYQGTTFGVEWMWNDERFADVNEVIDPETGLVLIDDEGNPVLASERFGRNGGYAYFETFLPRGFSFGGRFDYSEAVAGAPDRLRTTSAFLTWMPSEFHRLRLQFDNFQSDDAIDQRYTLQWTAFIGSHSHGFQNRAR